MLDKVFPVEKNRTYLIIRYLYYIQDKKKSSRFRNCLYFRAENGTQTRDPQLGRLVLYRLSYFRKKEIGCGQ